MKANPVILIVDDQLQNIDLLEAYLVPQGYEIVKAANGEEALEKLSGNQIDLILLDVIMPGMDGFEVTRRIRQDDKIRLLPIILVTILWETEDRIKGIEAGCDDFLSTPVDKTELLVRIRSLLKVKAYNDLMSNYRKELESEVTRRSDELKHAVENLQQENAEHKRTEEALRDSEARYRALFEISADGILLADTETKTFKYANPALCRMLGYTEEELKTLSLADIHPKEDLPRVIAEFEAQARGEKTLAPDIPCLRKDGTVLYADINTTTLTVDNRPCNVGFFRDITDRKRNEERLQKLNRSLKIISECNSCLVRATDEKDLLNDVCQIIRKTGEYPIVWIGLLEIAEKDVLRPVAYAGSEFFDYASEKIDLTDPNGRNKILRSVLSSGQFQVCQKLPDGRQPCFGPPSAANQPYRSILSLPLFFDNRTMGALTIYSASADTFDDEEKKLLLELADDISYGISALRTGVKHQRAEEQVMINLTKIENALEGTVMALTVTSEMRDPYTAGHQRRVTHLACAIAQDMGLPKDRINAIRVAGLLHDIGKITIPAEILTKPSKLTDVEFAMIKIHPKAAHDIIKSVDFPWPVAKYILQHHEKLNGSGYPSGLKGDEILMESRILCVADIVEAMSSHRPYRPALGIDAALGDMLANKGVLYDPVVVDSCVKLFREKGFKFE
ncbi:MAG TPA: HD domain-containing phosphohydrolase [bacterium]